MGFQYMIFLFHTHSVCINLWSNVRHMLAPLVIFLISSACIINFLLTYVHMTYKYPSGK